MSFLFLAVAAVGAPSSSPDEQAQAAIREFATYCDGGADLWGRSLCGPLILVDPATGRAVTNVDPKIAGFSRAGETWVGELPADVPMSNTAIELGGNRFAEIMLPLPGDSLDRRVLLAHESFHRIQPELGFTGREMDNSHLDTKDGRIWARLEMAALKAALTSRDWRPAARDALEFRAKRLSLFPNGSASEAALLANEGLAEYTGIKVGAGTNAVAMAVRRIDTGPNRQSLIRTFGYVVGPAYGILLDRTSAKWRSAALHGQPLPQLLQAAIGTSFRLSRDYGKDQIVAEETARDEQIQQRRRALMAELIDGPTVTFPGSDLQLEFDSNTLFSMGDKGTVYSRATTVRGNWGTLKASGDLLLAPGWSYARVQGPAKLEGQTLIGPNWTARLEPGYRPGPGEREGSLVVTKR